MDPEVLPDLGQLSEPPRVPQDPGLGLTLHVASELDPVAEVDRQVGRTDRDFWREI